ncbi:hypothetical protein LIER_02421 [Lithospermum erythrorhizon]|uniref:Uncharacterized protein n=1 Tax=Lithospermum erythrorhizon TaxID=34254 RepID=A0AAV3NPT7_LITER
MVFNKDLFMCQKQQQNGVVCTKPRRAQGESFRASPLIQINNHHIEAYGVKAGNELVDLILSKDACGGKKPNFHVALSPPFYNGSPPTRASNPVIQDEQFRTSKLNMNPSMIEPLASSASRLSGGGCVPVRNQTLTPERRIEGFNSLNNCNVSTIV